MKSEDMKPADTGSLEHRLRDAQNRYSIACKALARVHKGGEWEEWNIAHGALLTVERELAEVRGEEFAIPAEFPVRWDIGAPMPFLVKNDHKTFLIFYVRVDDPNWDGTYVTVKYPANTNADPMALVDFEGCVSAKLGSPNDEVHEGHPLAGKGLDSYTAQIVRNSTWLAELETINKVHRGYKGDRWRRLKHFVFWFHDSTFECIVEDYKVEVLHETLAQILARVYDRMN